MQPARRAQGGCVRGLSRATRRFQRSNLHGGRVREELGATPSLRRFELASPPLCHEITGPQGEPEEQKKNGKTPRVELRGLRSNVPAAALADPHPGAPERRGGICLVPVSAQEIHIAYSNPSRTAHCTGQLREASSERRPKPAAREHARADSEP